MYRVTDRALEKYLTYLSHGEVYIVSDTDDAFLVQIEDGWSISNR